jgi:polyphosphate glucokinase
MRVLAIDVGGTNVKFLATGHKDRRRFASGSTLTPRLMVQRVKELTKDWPYEAVSIGYPGMVHSDRPMAEPRNLGKGWVNFDFEGAFGHPVRIINDAAMQALGSYRGGTMLFLGFGTGLGAALVIDGGIVIPLELGILSYKDSTYEDYLGRRGLERLGKKKWRKHVAACVGRYIPALHLDDVVLGGGNAKILKTPPEGCRPGDNAYAFEGGFRMWAPDRVPAAKHARAHSRRASPQTRKAKKAH